MMRRAAIIIINCNNNSKGGAAANDHRHQNDVVFNPLLSDLNYNPYEIINTASFLRLLQKLLRLHPKVLPLTNNSNSNSIVPPPHPRLTNTIIYYHHHAVSTYVQQRPHHIITTQHVAHRRNHTHTYIRHNTVHRRLNY